MRSVPGIILLALLLVVSSAAAQTLDGTYTFASGDTFQYVETWKLREADDLVILSPPFGTIFMQDAAKLDYLGIDPEASLIVILREYHDVLADVSTTVNRRQRTALDIGGREALLYRYEEKDGKDGAVIVVRFTDGRAGVVDILGATLTDAHLEAALALAATFDSAAGQPASLQLSAQAVACTVRTNQANTVSVRVGPGMNRPAYAFLPTGAAFNVLGRADADDGSRWWKLDKQAVAPGKAANEAWVAQVDVTAAGNCEAILAALPPPVIPLAVPSVTNPAAEIVPQDGAWRASFRQAYGSCQGTAAVSMSLNLRSQTLTVSAQPGTAITISGDTLARIASNTYTGTASVIVDGQPVTMQFALRVVSPTQMEGDASFTLDDGQCSVTVGVAMFR